MPQRTEDHFRLAYTSLSASYVEPRWWYYCSFLHQRQTIVIGNDGRMRCVFFQEEASQHGGLLQTLFTVLLVPLYFKPCSVLRSSLTNVLLNRIGRSLHLTECREWKNGQENLKLSGGGDMFVPKVKDKIVIASMCHPPFVFALCQGRIW